MWPSVEQENPTKSVCSNILSEIPSSRNFLKEACVVPSYACHAYDHTY